MAKGDAVEGEKKPARVQGPRPAFIGLKGTDEASTQLVQDFQQAMKDGAINVTLTDRKADALLESLMAGGIDGFVRIMIK